MGPARPPWFSQHGGGREAIGSLASPHQRRHDIPAWKDSPKLEQEKRDKTETGGGMACGGSRLSGLCCTFRGPSKERKIQNGACDLKGGIMPHFSDGFLGKWPSPREEWLSYDAEREG